MGPLTSRKLAGGMAGIVGIVGIICIEAFKGGVEQEIVTLAIVAIVTLSGGMIGIQGIIDWRNGGSNAPP